MGQRDKEESGGIIVTSSGETEGKVGERKVSREQQTLVVAVADVEGGCKRDIGDGIPGDCRDSRDGVE